MKTILEYVNFVGVILLAGLCCIQWRTNGDLGSRLTANELARSELATRLQQDDKALQDSRSDLDDFRQRLVLAESQLKAAQQQIGTDTAQLNHLAAERDELKAELPKWIAAVAERDAALKKAADQAQTLIADRNDAVLKFNELAEQYNAEQREKTRSK